MKKISFVSERVAVAVVLAIMAGAFLVVMGAAHVSERTPSAGSWEAGFIEPECASCLDFFITNAQESGVFSYEIIYGNAILESGSVDVDFRETKDVAITEEDVATEGSGIYTIEIRDDSGTSREIYRRL